MILRTCAWMEPATADRFCRRSATSLNGVHGDITLRPFVPVLSEVFEYKYKYQILMLELTAMDAKP